MSMFQGLLIALLINFLVNYVIGAIDKYRTFKRWLIPNGTYWMGILNALGRINWAIRGLPTTVAGIFSRSDAYYYYPTQDEVDEALLVVHQMMIDGGWTVQDYLRRSKDCEDYAMKMSVELRNYIATTWTDKVGEKGVAIGIVGYTRDDGVGHVIVKVKLEDQSIHFYEPYPGEKYLKEMELSDKEINSISMDIM